MQSTHLLTPDGTTIPVAIRQSLRAKRITIKISHTSRQVELVYPKRTSLKRAMEFLHSKQGWISQQFFRLPDAIPFIPGQQIPVFGEMLVLHNIPQARGRSVIEDGQLSVTCLPEFFSRRVWDMLHRLLQKEIHSHVAEMARELGVKPKRITLRDTSSRWGSCSASGNLSFSRRLVFAPREIVEYLVAHEMSHLKEMNHSRAFWHHVAVLCPYYKKYSAWLKRHGGALHRYG